VRLGGVDLARIGLGTNRLTNTPHNAAFIKEAVAAGVQMIDTAHSYTGGQSEETIGEALAAATGSVLVATKGGIGGPGQGSRKFCAPRSSKASAASGPIALPSTTFTESIRSLQSRKALPQSRRTRTAARSRKSASPR